jgi:hypothetical protein
MPRLSPERLQSRLRARQFIELFVEELGWDRLRGVADITLDVRGTAERLKPVAQKRQVPLYLYRATPLPDRTRRRAIEGALARQQREHLIVFVDDATGAQVWQWVKREPGRPDRVREHAWRPGDDPEGLRQKLDALQFTLEEEEQGRIGATEVTDRLRRAFDADEVTKRFYDDYKARHDAIMAFLRGLPDDDTRSWYASVTLNRLMFIYFIQKKGFLCGDTDYLNRQLTRSQAERGPDKFFAEVLCPLFFEGFARLEAERSAVNRQLLGPVPYLNGGLFQQHQIEREHEGRIALPDRAFADLFSFFDGWRWHLDERRTGSAAGAPVPGREINPDVLGYIFEKYVNQKQMGAYYTKEDVTEYICANTILPRLLDKVAAEVKPAFAGPDSVWRLLRQDPDRYIWPSVRHGADQPLPDTVAAGVDNVSLRDVWNEAATRDLGLPTETWREVVHRRTRLEALRARLRNGDIASPDAMVTANLDIARFTADAIGEASEDALKAWWEALKGLTVLDPACGSGAFLFAALNILEPLYTAVFEAMQTTVADARRAAEAAGRTFDARRYRFFTEALDEAADHPNAAYFVLRQITLNNLFGVDLMEEAAEICKLRLFLKLIAQLDDPEQIEPLPDLDFNIRSGNSLVGFVSSATLDARDRPEFDLTGAAARINEEAEVAAKWYRRFQEMQSGPFDTRELAGVKDELQSRLARIAAEADQLLAWQYGVRRNQPRNFANWRRTHEPFHWATEFYGVMHAGGFDVVVGNPPYIARTKVAYNAARPGERLFPDIYGHFVLRTLALKQGGGRCGLIVPLSLTFGEDYEALREALAANGRTWLSSFDNIPAAIFNGVSQRCTIWIASPAVGPVVTSIMHRWRADYRTHLLETVQYHPLREAWPNGYGVPKLREASHERVLAILSRHGRTAPDRIFARRMSSHALSFAAAARNFISVFLTTPPELDAATLRPLVKTEMRSIPLASARVANASLAICAGDSHIWYWLVQGDGFHVTAGLVRAFIGSLGALDDEAIDLLAECGELIDHRRNECLVFKKNAGKYVGNFNYAPLADLCGAADELFLASLGVTAEDRRAVQEHVRRVLSINEAAGEKAIPAAVKARFPAAPVDHARQRALLRRMRAYVSACEAVPR